MPCQQPHCCDSIEYLMSQKFAAKVLTFYEMGNTRFTEYLRIKRDILLSKISVQFAAIYVQNNNQTSRHMQIAYASIP